MSRRYWYLFNGTGSDQVPGSYLSPSNIEPSCAPGAETCKIYVPGGSINPTPGAISQNIKAYLAAAKANQYGAYPLDSTPYVGARL